MQGIIMFIITSSNEHTAEGKVIFRRMYEEKEVRLL